jgi:predicted MFS family arabinose efflux permease
MSGLRALPLLAAAGFASMVSMRMCDAMLPALAQAFDARPAEAAQVVSAFALAYGLLQLAYGPLGDRFGKPRVISMATLACSGAALAAALSPTLDMLAASRVLMGGAAAGIIPLTMAWIGDQVPYAQRQEVLARLLGSTVLGMIAGSWAGGAVAQAAGWRTAFLAVAALFFALATMPHWAFSVPACLIAGMGFYMLHNTLQTCATQLSVTARGTAVSMFVCALFLGQAIGVALAAWFIDRHSAASWFAVAGPALLVLGPYFALRLRRQSNIDETAALLGGPR